MATIAAASLTFLDWAGRRGPDDKIASIIELLSQTNEIFLDMRVKEGNLTTGNMSTVRTGLPQGTWRQLYQGIQPTKSTVAQITDTAGNLEATSEVDIGLADLNGDAAATRLTEVPAFMEGLTQQIAGTLFYGSQVSNPERFTGLAPRYNTVNTANAQSAANVLDAGGTGNNNTSIWIVTWGDMTCHGFFPKGSQVGLQHQDLGKQQHWNPDQSVYWVYMDWYKWQLGLTVKDWRYVVRIANIDVPSLQGASAPNLINLLVRAMYRLPTTKSSMTAVQTSDAPTINAAMGQTVIYCNRDVRVWLDLQAQNKSNVLLQQGQFQGMPITTFRGVPVRTCDAILSTEARVV